MRRLFKQIQLLDSTNFSEDGGIKQLPVNVWQLRIDALDRKLEPLEFAAILQHIVKHRGYLSQRKNQSDNSYKDNNRLLSSIASNKSLLQTEQFRTPAEIAVKLFQMNYGHIRNKYGEYENSFDRIDIKQELQLIFVAQRKYENLYATAELEAQIIKLLMTQRPILSKEHIVSMLGHCKFETEQLRAAKMTYSAERFLLLTKLNNLKILNLGSETELTPQERELIIKEAYRNRKLTYAQLRKRLSLPSTAVFSSLKYNNSQAEIEKSTFIEMRAYHAISKAILGAGYVDEWNSLANDNHLLDEIGTAFSIYKTDVDITEYLQNLLPHHIIDVLLEKLDFHGFIELSLTALQKLLPLMEEGMLYKQACKIVYPHISLRTKIVKSKLLPVIPDHEIYNPVALRTLCQMRKVVNAIINQYGSPINIHIKIAHGLNKNGSTRKLNERIQRKQFQRLKQESRKFSEMFPYFVGIPTNSDLLRVRLFEQQQGLCLYSGKTIDIIRINDPEYVSVENVLPFSRCWDDSDNNKVLVLLEAKIGKEDQTLYEWFDGQNNSAKWQELVSRVMESSFSYNKKQHILLANINEHNLKLKNMRDGSYIATFLRGFINKNLILKRRHVTFIVNENIIAFLAERWGLSITQVVNIRQHAIPAIITACLTSSMQQYIAMFLYYKEIISPYDEIDTLVFPKLWDNFYQEVMIRVFNDNPQEYFLNLLENESKFKHEINRLFVSRAPTRKAKGKGHEDTVRTARYIKEHMTVFKVPLTDLKAEDIENIVGYSEQREKQFYTDLKERLGAHKFNSKLAFAKPFYKTSKNGKGTLVTFVKLKRPYRSGVLVHNQTGVAKNATMVRIDIFSAKGKFFVVPVYAWQLAKGMLPNKAVVVGKTEEEWQEMTEEFQFEFSLYTNDLIELETAKMHYIGYYSSFDRSNATIEIKEHDLDVNKGKNGIHKGVGVKTALRFEKLQVDILGNQISTVHQRARL